MKNIINRKCCISGCDIDGRDNEYIDDMVSVYAREKIGLSIFRVVI